MGRATWESAGQSVLALGENVNGQQPGHLAALEPPAQVTPTRVALADLTLGGVLIPKGSAIWVMWAAANRDPRHFTNPNQFDPDREHNDHLGFGGGIHACFGAPLARLEVQIALTEIFRRLENPRLVVDPPPYRRNPFLRGPSHLPIAFDRVRPGSAYYVSFGIVRTKTSKPGQA